MEKTKLGPWHPEGVRPVHVGVYEVDLADEDGRAFACWGGAGWGYIKWEKFYDRTVAGAIRRASIDPVRFDPDVTLGWRGLIR